MSLSVAASVALGVALVLFVWRALVPWKRWRDVLQMAAIVGVAGGIGASTEGLREAVATGLGAALFGGGAYWSGRRSREVPERIPRLPDIPLTRFLGRLAPWLLVLFAGLEIAAYALIATDLLETPWGTAVLVLIGLLVAFTVVLAVLLWRASRRLSRAARLPSEAGEILR